jgi:hypothetical protein
MVTAAAAPAAPAATVNAWRRVKWVIVSLMFCFLPAASSRVADVNTNFTKLFRGCLHQMI